MDIKIFFLFFCFCFCFVINIFVDLFGGQSFYSGGGVVGWVRILALVGLGGTAETGWKNRCKSGGEPIC